MKPTPRQLDEIVTLFLGFLYAQIPELHDVHPEQLLATWDRFKIVALRHDEEE